MALMFVCLCSFLYRTGCVSWKRRCACSTSGCTSSWRKISVVHWKLWTGLSLGSARRTLPRFWLWESSATRLRSCWAPSTRPSVRQRNWVSWKTPNLLKSSQTGERTVVVPGFLKCPVLPVALRYAGDVCIDVLSWVLHVSWHLLQVSGMRGQHPPSLQSWESKL